MPGIGNRKVSRATLAGFVGPVSPGDVQAIRLVLAQHVALLENTFSSCSAFKRRSEWETQKQAILDFSKETYLGEIGIPTTFMRVADAVALGQGLDNKLSAIWDVEAQKNCGLVIRPPSSGGVPWNGILLVGGLFAAAYMFGPFLRAMAPAHR